MFAIETLTMIGVGLLFALAIAVLWIGFLGIVGEVRFVRCPRCNHLEAAPAYLTSRACVRCRHEHVFHPVVAIHHSWAEHHPGSAGTTSRTD